MTISTNRAYLKTNAPDSYRKPRWVLAKIISEMASTAANAFYSLNKRLVQGSLSLCYAFSQLFPPAAAFTEHHVPSLEGKVYIVTGGNSGIGFELAQLLYSKHARVYLACRSATKTQAAMASIQEANPDSRGTLTHIHLDLADLSTIKASAQEFLAKETTLTVLFNNAGVMHPPAGSKTVQGYDMQLGVNCVGAFLFTKLLTPVLVSTAKVQSQGSVRIVWVSSSALDGLSPPGGVEMDNLDYHLDRSSWFRYGSSKAGNYLHATESGRRLAADGVLSIPCQPGNLDSELYRDQTSIARWFLRRTVLWPSIYGAYTLLFAGLAEEVVGKQGTGDWVVPWGRYLPVRRDVYEASKPRTEGGSGIARDFWNWSETQVQKYA